MTVRGNFESDNWLMVRDAARAGLGIVRVLQVGEQDSIDPDLVPIFSREVVSNRSLWALMHRMQPTPRKIEAFLTFLEAELKRCTAVNP